MTGRICRRCVMDTSFPEIRFDEQGICNHCRQFERQLEQFNALPDESLAERLNEVVAVVRGSRRENSPDCLVGLSGGVDSTYLAYLARQHGLSPLGLHVDNGWNSMQAEENIAACAEKLGIEVIRIRPDWEEFKDLQLAFLHASVPGIEIPTDHAIRSLLYKTALRHGLQHVLAGGNFATEGILPTSVGWNWRDVRYIKAILRRFGKERLHT